MTTGRRLLAAVIMGALLASCGGDASDETTGPRPLSTDEAARLAQATYGNLLSEGAVFEANSAFTTYDPAQTVNLRGEVDWVDRSGRAYVTANGPDATLVEVYWKDGLVFERRPDADQLVASLGGPTEPWFVRPAEPETRQVDRLLALLVALANEQPENALLIQQTEGSSFIRADELRGQPVEVLRYGTRNLYWLAATDGSMLRFEGNSASGGAPTLIDLGERGPARFDPPPASSVVPVEQFEELYSAFSS